MATVKILYWQEIPTQIKVEDADGSVVDLAMPPRFMERVDLMAAKRGLTGGDDYLAQFQWSDEVEREGNAQNVAQAVLAELEAAHRW